MTCWYDDDVLVKCLSTGGMMTYLRPDDHKLGFEIDVLNASSHSPRSHCRNQIGRRSRGSAGAGLTSHNGQRSSPPSRASGRRQCCSEAKTMLATPVASVALASLNARLR